MVILKNMKNQFNRIMLLDEITNQLVAFGMNSGDEKFADYVDLNCGAIPQGRYDQIIDPQAPQQFLSLYTQIADKRFAFAVNRLLNLNPAMKESLIDFCRRSGQALNLPVVENAEQAFCSYCALVLDGLPWEQTKEILEKNECKIIWKKIFESHETAWNGNGFDIGFYYELLQSFVEGLFFKSGFTLKITDQKIFELSKS